MSWWRLMFIVWSSLEIIRLCYNEKMILGALGVAMFRIGEFLIRKIWFGRIRVCSGFKKFKIQLFLVKIVSNSLRSIFGLLKSTIQKCLWIKIEFQSSSRGSQSEALGSRKRPIAYHHYLPSRGPQTEPRPTMVCLAKLLKKLSLLKTQNKIMNLLTLRQDWMNL